MKKANNQICADAGGKYCPCHLAYSGDCIKCSLIQGCRTCDCKWQGVCIYNELQHSKNVSVNERKEVLCQIVETKEVENNTFLIKIQVPKHLINDLCSPGAYVLLKSKDKNNQIFNTPISVMDVDLENSILEVVIKPVGIKTKSIVNFDEVWVKAPYFNGIFGIKEVKTNSHANCVVVLNGLSQINSINVIKRLLRNNNKVEVFINNKSSVLDVVIDKIINLGVNIQSIDLYEDKDFLIDYIRRNNVEFVYSSGSARFSKYVMELVDSIDENIKLAISNNNLICCGEGICGACTININGQRVKTCKAQVDSREYLKTI